MSFSINGLLIINLGLVISKHLVSTTLFLTKACTKYRMEIMPERFEMFNLRASGPISFLYDNLFFWKNDHVSYFIF